MMPSLKGLQAFEAAARTGSFVAAAEELSVTPAAVSQLIRTLENQCGRKLFVRIHRGIMPSEAGLEILPALGTAFSELQAVSHQLSGRLPSSQLTVSVPPSIASGWLGRRLEHFLASSPALDVSLRSDEDPIAFENDRIDIRMSYGAFHYRGHTTTEVLVDAIHPVCAPAFLERHGPFVSIDELLAVPLIHTDWGPSAATFPSWQHWFTEVGVPVGNALSRRGLSANLSTVALDLACDGLGVALCQGLLIAGPVARGELVLPVARSLPLSQPYCLTIADSSVEREPVRRFERWFRLECESNVAAMKRAASASLVRQ